MFVVAERPADDVGLAAELRISRLPSRWLDRVPDEGQPVVAIQQVQCPILGYCLNTAD
jgi:hypothetical protein